MDSAETEYSQAMQEFLSVHFIQQEHSPLTVAWKVEKNSMTETDHAIPTINKENNESINSTIPPISSEFDSSGCGKESSDAVATRSDIIEQSSDCLEDDKAQCNNIERNILPVEIASKD